MVKNEICLRDAITQNAFFFEKYTPKNALKPPMFNIGQGHRQMT